MNYQLRILSPPKYHFGENILISREEVKLLLGLALALVILYAIFRKPLYVMSFDEAAAKTAGLPVRFISIVFSIITGITISIMMPIVGALLVSALIVIPSATAIKISRSFSQAIFLGILINIIGIFGGLTASYHFDTPPGASITIGFVFIFICVSVFTAVKHRMNR